LQWTIIACKKEKLICTFQTYPITLTSEA